MAEYGFTASDINSLTSAREGLVAGFMQLGKQIQTDITRIATIREMKSFGQELANLDPTNDNFPQQLIGTLSKYPLASSTPIAQKGIEVLGTRYRAAQQAKQTTARSLRGQLINTEEGQFLVNPVTGETIQDYGPKPSATRAGRVIDTGEKQLLINPETGETIQEFAPKPTSAASQRLPEATRMQLNTLKDTERRITTERQKLLDGINSGTIGAKNVQKARDDIAALEGDLQAVQSQRGKILSQFSVDKNAEAALPSGAGQGTGGASLMPSPQNESSFVPMAMPTNIAAPAMTLRQEGDAVMPDNLPVLPGVKPPPKQAGTPRLYRIENGQFKAAKSNLKQAIEQAYADQSITEEQRSRYLQTAGLQ